MPYQEGKDETGAYNPVKSYRGGIPIPTGSVAPQMLTPSMMFNMAPEPQELPVPDFYAAGVDKLNIEFNKVNEHTGFIVSANGSNLLEQQIDRRVYTLEYDFSTLLKVTVTDGRQEQHYEVNPLSLRRNILPGIQIIIILPISAYSREKPGYWQVILFIFMADRVDGFR